MQRIISKNEVTTAAAKPKLRSVQRYSIYRNGNPEKYKVSNALGSKIVVKQTKNGTTSKSTVTPCPFFRILQNDYSIFVFSMQASTLLDLCYFSSVEKDRENGVQRPYKDSRGKEIAEYIETDNSTLPNSIIINLELKKHKLRRADIFQDGNVNVNRLKKFNTKERQIAFVIDGQHRLRAFKEAQKKDFPLIVAAYIDLSLAEVAEIFVKINYFQKPVNKSMVYYLLGIDQKVFPEYYGLHSVVELLNNDISSPFFDQIKMLGIGKGMISQASIISAIEKYKTRETMNSIGLDGNNVDILYNVLWVYFSSIQSAFKNDWNNKESYLNRNITIRAFFKLLNDFLNYYSKNKINFYQDKLKAHLKRIKIDFKDKKYFSGLGGEKGVSLIAREFHNDIFGEKF